MKKTLKDLDFKNKKVLVRCDFNVPIKDGKITDDLRIVSSIPTIRSIIDGKGIPILISHLGRPKGVPNEKLSLLPVASRLGELLGKEVIFAKSDKVVDAYVREKAFMLKQGEVMLLENLRFREEEEKNDENFSKDLASLADFFVNDAFGTSHRAHASNVGVAELLPSALGLLVEKEVGIMGKALSNPKLPFVVILGGAKISDKISVIKNLINKVDALLIGGAMANTFLLSQGYSTGKSLVDTENTDFAREMLRKAKERGVALVLPKDLVLTTEISDNANFREVKVDEISEQEIAVDIGSETVAEFEKFVSNAGTVVWNGPMGIFEHKAFSKGTFEVAKMMANSRAITIVGGGDSSAAVEQSGFSEKITHISTGGGASLEFLEGKLLPGIEVIGDRDE